MIKVTTEHGTFYLIDMDRQIAKRVKGEGRNKMYHDGEWWDFYDVFAYDRVEKKRLGDISVGHDMFFKTGHGMYDWRISTSVVSIEEIE